MTLQSSFEEQLHGRLRECILASMDEQEAMVNAQASHLSSHFGELNREVCTYIPVMHYIIVIFCTHSCIIMYINYVRTYVRTYVCIVTPGSSENLIYGTQLGL